MHNWYRDVCCVSTQAVPLLAGKLDLTFLAEVHVLEHWECC